MHKVQRIHKAAIAGFQRGHIILIIFLKIRDNRRGRDRRVIRFNPKCSGCRFFRFRIATLYHQRVKSLHEHGNSVAATLSFVQCSLTSRGGGHRIHAFPLLFSPPVLATSGLANRRPDLIF